MVRIMKTKNRKSAVFILSHGRPDRVKTINMLKKGTILGTGILFVTMKIRR